MMKFYYDLMSQPSRALYIIFKLSKVEYQDCPVALRKGEHQTDQFKTDINRFQKVPCIITSDNFQLSESIAILRFLASNEKIDKKLYPSDLKQRARIDEYLEWQHNNTRMACAMYFRQQFLEPKLLNMDPNEQLIQYFKMFMEQTLDNIEEIWLKNTKYIAGNDLSVADIFAACEIEQTVLTKYNPSENRPKLTEWLKLVKQNCSPHYDDAHKFLYILNKKFSKL